MRYIFVVILCSSIFCHGYSQTYPLSAGTIGSPQTICYNTAPDRLVQLTTPRRGTGTYTYQWQYSTDKTTWNIISGETSATYDPPALTENRWFRLRVTSGPGTVVTNSVLITVNPSLTSGTIEKTQSICYNATPETLRQISAPAGGSGRYEYQWQSSLNNSSWTDISGATFADYISPALTNDIYYRRKVTSEMCGTANSAPVHIKVYPPLTTGTIGGEKSISYNTSPASLMQLTPPSGGTGIYNYQWQNSKDNTTWYDIPEATFADYSPAALTTSTFFRRIVTSGSCTMAGSSVMIKVILTSGSVGTAQSVCYNTVPAILTQLTAPTGGNGDYTYQWQSSHDNINWTYITGATMPDYSPPALSENTYYRRIVTSDNYTISSASVLISVMPQFTGVQLHENTSILENTSASFNAVISGGTSPYTINYTRNGVTQTPINTYTSGTGISTGVLSTGNYTFALTFVADNNGCTAPNTGQSITISVIPILSPGSIGTSQSICYSSVPAPLTQITAPAGGVGNYAYQWQSSNDNINWTTITGATHSGYSPPALSANTYYRRNITSGTYSVSSASVLISVLAPITTVQLHDNTSIYNNTSTTFNVDILGGTSPFSIRYARNGLVQSAINNYTSGSGISTGILSSGSYAYTITSVTDSRGCVATTSGTAITVIVFPPLTPGSIGSSQSICYNSVPSPLTQKSAPSGASGNYVYQWQRSSDNVSWTNITGATLPGYEPAALITSLYYRRAVRSGPSPAVYTAPVLIKVLSAAQLMDNKTIYNNSSANFKINITGGTAPYIINYTRNGTVQTAINNYTSGDVISTGLLATGIYSYTLTSVTDADGYGSCSLGTNITVSVLSDLDVRINNALVVVNSESSFYPDYVNYIKPYLDNFGIPYTECDISSATSPEFHNFGIIIFGHKNVYSSAYPITELETAVSEGAGLYSFDPRLFDYSSGFNTLIAQKSVSSSLLNISNTSHYITQSHVPDVYNPDNNSVSLLSSWTVVQKSNLVGAVDLVEMSSGGQTVSLLQVARYGTGKVVKWCGYNWMFENILGPVYGMDDLLWRGIVWAARKPFAIQGMPPFITMRVDDVTGSDGGVTDDFNWIKISNDFGLIPWCGTFNNAIAEEYIPTLKTLIDNNKATAFPHSFTWNRDFIYFNHNNLANFDAAANTVVARDFYITNGLKFSNYLVPHYYEISSTALPGIKAMGADFIGIHMLPDQLYYSDPADLWINCGPYRLNRNGYATTSRPVYYGGNVLLNGIEFFNCLTEIRDDGSYEWFPDNDVVTTVARGIRHLRRSLNSMVLPSLFTHEYYISPITTSNWREIISQITSAISGYNPEFTSTDYAVKYIRARNNIKITDVVETNLGTEISYSGTNDMDTKCYLFTEESGVINYHFVALPQVDVSNKVNDPK